MRTAALVVSICTLGLGLAACGSSGNANTTASGGGFQTSSSARYQARLSLAKCLRAHGLNVPDPSSGGGIPGGGGEFRILRDAPNFRPALQACSSYLREAFPFRALTPAQRAQFQQAFVKFAQCMRAHGIDIPDPSTQSGGGFGLRRDINPAERNSPAFQSAFRACATSLPFRRGGGPGGPAGAVAGG
jgi:hypothetical protein